MASPEKPKVSKARERKQAELLVWHEPCSYRGKNGRTVQVKGHWEICSGLDAAQKAEAQKLKAEKEGMAGRKPIQKASKRVPRPEKHMTATKESSIRSSKSSTVDTKEGRDETSVPAAEAEADA